MTKQKGFTLTEILIVMAIIGILLAIAIPSLTRARLEANCQNFFGYSYSAAMNPDTRDLVSDSCKRETVTLYALHNRMIDEVNTLRTTPVRPGEAARILARADALQEYAVALQDRLDHILSFAAEINLPCKVGS